MRVSNFPMLAISKMTYHDALHVVELPSKLRTQLGLSSTNGDACGFPILGMRAAFGK